MPHIFSQPMRTPSDTGAVVPIAGDGRRLEPADAQPSGPRQRCHKRPGAALLAAAAALLLAVGCRGGGQVAHPTAENIIPASQIAYTIRETAAPEPDLSAVVARLQRARTEYLLTSPERDDSSRFGLILGVLPLEAGYAVLDIRRAMLDVFDDDGKKRLSIPLGGPKAAGRLRGLARLPDGRIVIGGDQQLRVFEISESGSVTEHPPWSVAGQTDDLCAIGSRLFVRAIADSGNLIHEFQHSAPTGLSFRSAYRSSDAGIRRDLSRGRFACLQAAGAIVDGFNILLPYLTAYASTGTLLWTSAVGDYLRPRVVEYTVDGETMMTHGQRGAHDILITLAPLEPGHILVQLARLQPGSDDATIRTFVLDAKTGKGMYGGEAIPWIKATSATRLFAVKPVTADQLTVLAWQ